MAPIRRIGFVLVLLVAGRTSTASAQCSGNGGFIITPSPALVPFATPTILHFDAGSIVYGTTVAVTVRPPNNGARWSFCVSAATPTLGTAGDYTKALADLEYSHDGGPWTPLTTSEQLLVSNQRQTQTILLQLRMRLSWDADAPGTFGTLMNYTAAR